MYVYRCVYNVYVFYIYKKYENRECVTSMWTCTLVRTTCNTHSSTNSKYFFLSACQYAWVSILIAAQANCLSQQGKFRSLAILPQRMRGWSQVKASLKNPCLHSSVFVTVHGHMQMSWQIILCFVWVLMTCTTHSASFCTNAKTNS